MQLGAIGSGALTGALSVLLALASHHPVFVAVASMGLAGGVLAVGAGALAAFVERRRDAGVMLDHVGQGLLLLDRLARPAPARSAVAEQWLGPVAPGETFAELLGRVDRRAGAAFEVGWAQLLDDVLPVEVAIDQLPRAFRRGERAFEIAYTPVLEKGGLARVLVAIADVTERAAREHADAEQRELLTALERLGEDRAAFLEFVADARLLVDRLCGADRPERRDLQRDLHTLKGNASLHGLTRLADLCHELEDAVAGRDDLDPPSRRTLRGRWDGFERRIEALLGAHDPGDIAVSEAEYAALALALEDGAPREELARTIAAWRLEPAGARLARHGAQARALAQQLGKGAIDVVIEGDTVRLEREAMAPFWNAFSHAVRNAVAHGLELPQERVAAAKGPVGTVFLRSRRAGDRVVVEIADDGCGIDWDAVRARAVGAGLPARTADDLQAALFHDGLTTRDEADGVSGRGLGMGILRAECERLDGSIAITSAPGVGTTLSFSFPAATVSGARLPPRPLQSRRRRSVGTRGDALPRAASGRR